MIKRLALATIAALMLSLPALAQYPVSTVGVSVGYPIPGGGAVNVGYSTNPYAAYPGYGYPTGSYIGYPVPAPVYYPVPAPVLRVAPAPYYVPYRRYPVYAPPVVRYYGGYHGGYHHR